MQSRRVFSILLSPPPSLTFFAGCASGEYSFTLLRALWTWSCAWTANTFHPVPWLDDQVTPLQVCIFLCALRARKRRALCISTSCSGPSQ